MALQIRYDLYNDELDDNALIVLLQAKCHPSLVDYSSILKNGQSRKLDASYEWTVKGNRISFHFI